MTAFYICAILMAPMLFMGMIGTASAEESTQEPLKDSAVLRPGAYTYPPHSSFAPEATVASVELDDGPPDYPLCGNMFDDLPPAVKGPGGSRTRLRA